jgi:hypothetical protein
MSVAWPQKTVKGFVLPGTFEERRCRFLQNPDTWVPRPAFRRGRSTAAESVGGSRGFAETLCRLCGFRMRGMASESSWRSWAPRFGQGNAGRRSAGRAHLSHLPCVAGHPVSGGREPMPWDLTLRRRQRYTGIGSRPAGIVSKWQQPFKMSPREPGLG